MVIQELHDTMPLEKIQIKNFQQHKDLTIEFDPITTIIGPTGAGKSGVIRALKWVFCNTPSGFSFINWDSKRAEVSLNVDGHTIIRSRQADSFNMYKLDDQEYKAFGNTVPRDIAQILNVNELNFKKQFDQPFWFQKTAGEVSRSLNKIVDLSLIDISQTNITGITRKTNTEMEVIKDRLGNFKKQGKTLKWVLNCDKELIKLEESNKKINKLINNLNELKDLISDANSLNKEVQILKEEEQDLQMVFKAGNVWASHQTILDDLNSILSNIKDIPSKKEISVLIDKLKIFEKITIQHDEISKYIDQYNYLDTQKDEELLIRLENKFRKEMGDSCPLCNSPIKL